ncbi:MAG: hypothetical protein A2216_00620 [Omnitrophica WOR_2 bacterium RIFOXYA2_FULL_45_12]|nr:MAG: hypothetical protein A2216_00620 [Omnitrophica WOR_2 bacterium RIFOXYA2_FULL_45_12]
MAFLTGSLNVTIPPHLNLRQKHRLFFSNPQGAVITFFFTQIIHLIVTAIFSNTLFRGFSTDIQLFF